MVERKKNWAVYILFFIAVIAGILAFIDAGRYMGWMPIYADVPGLGEISFFAPETSWLAAFMQTLLGLIWFLVAYWLWTLNPSGWLFLVVVATINLVFLALAIIGRSTFSQVLPAVIVSALALLLALLPSTKRAFMGTRSSDAAVMAAAAAAAERTAVGEPPPADVEPAEIADEGVEGAGDEPLPAAEIGDAEFAAARAEAMAVVIDAMESDEPPDLTAVPDEAQSAEAVVAEDTPAAAVVSDDLLIVEGIGPKTASVLAAAGINSLMDLALTSQEELLNIIREAGLRGDPSTWPRQAALAASGNMEELQAYQDELTGGREA